MSDDKFQRGEHDIEHEISFASNVRFVFHDSRGFEAGSEDELQKVQSFIEQRARERKLGNRLHAIWFKHMQHCYLMLILMLFIIGAAFQ